MEEKRKYKYIWKYVEVIGTRDYHNRILSLIPRQMTTEKMSEGEFEQNLFKIFSLPLRIQVKIQI